MKKVLLLFCAVLLTTVCAGTAAALVSIDPITPIIPIPTLDPCFGADFTANVVIANEYDLDFDASHYISVFNYELKKGSTTVGRGFSKYTSQMFGTSAYVASEETIIVDSLSMTVFGQSSNRTSGIAGSRGIITGAIKFNGQKRSEVQGTYLFTDFGGSLKICGFITP